MPNVNIVNMTAKCQLDVIIVGAGMGGLGTALALRQAGHRVTVLEQAPEFVEVSRNHSFLNVYCS